MTDPTPDPYGRKSEPTGGSSVSRSYSYPVNHEPFSPVGARVTGLSLGEVTPDRAFRLRGLVATHGVVVFAQQQELEREAFETLLRTIGLAGIAAGPGVAGLQRPPSSERALDVAERPTEVRSEYSVFSNQYRAFETLPVDIRGWLLGRSAQCTARPPSHSPGGVAEYVLFRRHPLTGRVVLHLPDRAHGWVVSGLPDDVGAEMIGYLVDHSTGADNVLRHPWSFGDILLWDTWSVRCVADPDRASGS